MREIKFRAWDNEHNTGMFYPLEWFFGNVVKAKHPAGKTIEVIPMQMTGLKDKNGKEIYEGDVVRGQFTGYSDNEVRTGQIIFGEGGFQFTDKNQIEFYFPINQLKEHEVIGNKYENKDLLK